MRAIQLSLYKVEIGYYDHSTKAFRGITVYDVVSRGKHEACEIGIQWARVNQPFDDDVIARATALKEPVIGAIL